MQDRELVTEAQLLTAHLETITADSQFSAHVQSMGQHMATTNASIKVMQDMLDTIRPTMEASRTAMERLAVAEERRVAIEENAAKAAAEAARLAAEAAKEKTGLQYAHVWGPLIAAVSSLITAVAMYWSSPGG
jgi:regulator of protease activity HflC (stomatin/prohibitin superfamily)